MILAKFGWAPGLYLGKCADCGVQFMGAKRCLRCEKCAQARLDAAIANPPPPEEWAFQIGDWVAKPKGSWWEGVVVGTYSTEDTPRGYCVQLMRKHGPVQIYPEAALELVERAKN